MTRNAMAYALTEAAMATGPARSTIFRKTRPLPLNRAEDHAVIQTQRPPLNCGSGPRGIVELLSSLPVRERTTILAQAVSRGNPDPVRADQILLAIAFDEALQGFSSKLRRRPKDGAVQFRWLP